MEARQGLASLTLRPVNTELCHHHLATTPSLRLIIVWTTTTLVLLSTLVLRGAAAAAAALLLLLLVGRQWVPAPPRNAALVSETSRSPATQCQEMLLRATAAAAAMGRGALVVRAAGPTVLATMPTTRSLAYVSRKSAPGYRKPPTALALELRGKVKVAGGESLRVGDDAPLTGLLLDKGVMQSLDAVGAAMALARLAKVRAELVVRDKPDTEALKEAVRQSLRRLCERLRDMDSRGIANVLPFLVSGQMMQVAPNDVKKLLADIDVVFDPTPCTNEQLVGVARTFAVLDHPAPLLFRVLAEAIRARELGKFSEEQLTDLVSAYQSLGHRLPDKLSPAGLDAAAKKRALLAMWGPSRRRRSASAGAGGEGSGMDLGGDGEEAEVGSPEGGAEAGAEAESDVVDAMGSSSVETAANAKARGPATSASA